MATEKRLDLIDRKALGIGYCNPLVFDKIEYAHGWNCAIEILMKAPTVDAVEVAHGRWIGKEEKLWNMDYPVVTCWECSECGVFGHYTQNYCHNCGADMRERKTDE